MNGMNVPKMNVFTACSILPNFECCVLFEKKSTVVYFFYIWAENFQQHFFMEYALK